MRINFLCFTNFDSTIRFDFFCYQCKDRIVRRSWIHLQDVGRKQYVADFEESDDEEGEEAMEDGAVHWSPPNTSSEESDGDSSEDDDDDDKPSTSKTSKQQKKTKKAAKKPKRAQRPRVEIEYETEPAETRQRMKVKH
jgi:hypothetical protein